MTQVTVNMMYEAAVEAVEHVGRANYPERQEAAIEWLARVLQDKVDLSIDQVAEAIEDAREAWAEKERGEKQTALDKELKRHREAVKKIKIGS